MADGADLTPMFWAGLTGDTAPDFKEILFASLLGSEGYTKLGNLSPDLISERKTPREYETLTAAREPKDPETTAEVERVKKVAAEIPPVSFPAADNAPATDEEDPAYNKKEAAAYENAYSAALEKSLERARALWLKEVVECAEGTIYYLDLQLCVLVEPAARPLHGYILNHESDVYAIDGDWDGSETEGIMKHAKAVRVVPDRKGVQAAPLSWDALLALLAYETVYLEGDGDAATALLNATLTIERDKKAHEEVERIEAMPRRTSVNHQTTDAFTHALRSLTVYGQSEEPKGREIEVAGRRGRTAPAKVSAYLQAIQEMPTSRHLTTLHETVLAAITSLYIEAPRKGIMWGDIAYQMGYSDHPREVCKKIAQCCKELADIYTVTDWTGAGRIKSLTDEVKGKRGIVWRLIDAGWIYDESGEVIGFELGRAPANLQFSKQMNNQIDTFPRARLLYGIDTGAGERMTEPKQYIAYKLEDHINTMNRSRKVKAGETYTVRLIASAKHPERPGLLEEAGVNVNDSGRKKRAVDYVRRVLDGHLAEGTIAGYEIVKEGRKIAAVNITKKGRRKR